MWALPCSEGRALLCLTATAGLGNGSTLGKTLLLHPDLASGASWQLLQHKKQLRNPQNQIFPSLTTQ